MGYEPSGRARVVCSCGHRETVNLYGGERRKKRIIRRCRLHPCTECRAAGSDMTGTVSQIAWAEDIKAEKISEWDRVTHNLRLSPLAEDMYSAVLSQKSARWWIDHRNDSMIDLVRKKVEDEHALYSLKPA